MGLLYPIPRLAGETGGRVKMFSLPPPPSPSPIPLPPSPSSSLLFWGGRRGEGRGGVGGGGEGAAKDPPEGGGDSVPPPLRLSMRRERTKEFKNQLSKQAFVHCKKRK